MPHTAPLPCPFLLTLLLPFKPPACAIKPGVPEGAPNDILPYSHTAGLHTRKGLCRPLCQRQKALGSHISPEGPKVAREGQDLRVPQGGILRPLGGLVLREGPQRSSCVLKLDLHVFTNLTESKSDRHAHETAVAGGPLAPLGRQARVGWAGAPAPRNELYVHYRCLIYLLKPLNKELK